MANRAVRNGLHDSGNLIHVYPDKILSHAFDIKLDAEWCSLLRCNML